MFVSERIVFVHLQKTGGTHIHKVLSQLVDGQAVGVGKHDRPKSHLFTPGRTFVGSVRDPWDWYVSLWAAGCNRKGGLYASVTKRKSFRGWGWRRAPLRATVHLFTELSRSRGKWLRTYEDINDPSRFREWLRMVHDPRYWSDFGEGFATSPVNRLVGLLSHRYLTLFWRGPVPATAATWPSTHDLLEHDRQACYIDHFIRNENLEQDLLHALERSGITISDQARARVLASGRTNPSLSRREASHYYDRETSDLVARREQLIVTKFGYSPPPL
jgi:hypothetical protein